MSTMREIHDHRMAELASRITSPSPSEREYASLWLDRLWYLHELVFGSERTTP